MANKFLWLFMGLLTVPSAFAAPFHRKIVCTKRFARGNQNGISVYLETKPSAASLITGAIVNYSQERPGQKVRVKSYRLRPPAHILSTHALQLDLVPQAYVKVEIVAEGELPTHTRYQVTYHDEASQPEDFMSCSGVGPHPGISVGN